MQTIHLLPARLLNAIRNSFHLTCNSPTTTGASSGAAFNGSIDEVRISLGEVEVADFLYAPPPGATVIYMR